MAMAEQSERCSRCGRLSGYSELCSWCTRQDALEEAARIADDTEPPSDWTGAWYSGFRNGRSAVAAKIREELSPGRVKTPEGK